jgi:hypothetical protein
VVRSAMAIIRLTFCVSVITLIAIGISSGASAEGLPRAQV